MEQRLLLNLDWLGISICFSGGIQSVPAGYKLVDYDGTKVWRHRRVLYTDDGQRVLTLLSNPKSNMIKENAALVEIENEWLYHGITKKEILDLLADIIHYGRSGLSRIDLCVDFNPTRVQAEIIEGLATGKYYVAGKQHGSLFWSINHPNMLKKRELDGSVEKVCAAYTNLDPYWLGRRIPHCQSWGHKTSDVKWKLYYKTKELIDAAGGHGFDKPYIVDKWREAGLDIKNVWRLEVSIQHGNNFKYMDQTLTYDVMDHNTVNLFKALYTSRFQVRRNEGHKDKTNDELVQFLPVGSIAHAFHCLKREPLTDRSPRLTMLRHLYKSMEEPAVLMDDDTREDTLWMMQRLIERDNLYNYFDIMAEMQFADYVENKRCEAYNLLMPQSPVRVSSALAPNSD